jgi:hypothetical protein
VVVVLAALPFVAAQEPAKKNADAKPGVKAGKDDADVKDEVKKTDKTTKKEKEKDEDLEKKAEKKEKLVYGANFTAKLKEMDANSQKDFTLEMKIPVPNPQGIQDLANAQNSWAQRQAQIQQAFFQNKNFQQRARDLFNLQQQIQRDYPRLQANTMKLESKDFKVRAADNIRVRAIAPPLDYDDKGNVKKYTKKELEALKGPDKKLPGYTAEYEALHAGQIVHVYLAKNEANPVKGKGAKAGGGIKLNPDDDAGIGEHRPQVVMIVILAEPKDR